MKINTTDREDNALTPADAAGVIQCTAVQNQRSGAHLIRIPRETLRAINSAGGSSNRITLNHFTVTQRQYKIRRTLSQINK